MPFLPPNQQRQSTEGIYSTTSSQLNDTDYNITSNTVLIYSNFCQQIWMIRDLLVMLACQIFTFIASFVVTVWMMSKLESISTWAWDVISILSTEAYSYKNASIHRITTEYLLCGSYYKLTRVTDDSNHSLSTQPGQHSSLVSEQSDSTSCCCILFLHFISNDTFNLRILLLLLPFNGLFSRTTWVSRYQKGKINLDFTGARVAVASAGPYASLHLAPDR